jgi:hypothetical protein
MRINANISSIRGGSVSADFSAGRGGQVGAPKKSFGSKLGEATDSDLVTALDRVHGMMRGAMTPAQMSDLLDEYIVIAAWRARSRSLARGPAIPFAPSGSVLAAVLANLSS